MTTDTLFALAVVPLWCMALVSLWCVALALVDGVAWLADRRTKTVGRRR
jgi:hypothetical protein